MFSKWNLTFKILLPEALHYFSVMSWTVSSPISDVEDLAPSNTECDLSWE